MTLPVEFVDIATAREVCKDIKIDQPYRDHRWYNPICVAVERILKCKAVIGVEYLHLSRPENNWQARVVMTTEMLAFMESWKKDHCFPKDLELLGL